MIIVTDTGPVNYLLLSGQIELIAKLYGQLVVPLAVQRELLHERAPSIVRNWANSPPDWVEVRSASDASKFSVLGPGEREAISLALELTADYVLVDDGAARMTAIANGIAVKGSLAVLQDASDSNLVDLATAIKKLRSTNIFLSDALVNEVLEQHRKKRI